MASRYLLRIMEKNAVGMKHVSFFSMAFVSNIFAATTIQ